MFAYLKKSEGSEDFHHIVDFLNYSHIKYALTENPPIYESFIKQFWQTASASTLEDGEVGITAIIDGQLKTATEASLRRHLKLEDVDGISSLPNTEIFEQRALIGYYPILISAPTNSQPPLSSPLRTTLKQETKVPQPSSPSQTHDADEVASTRVDVRLRGAATTVSSLDAGQGSGNIDKTPSMPYDSPLPGRGVTHWKVRFGDSSKQGRKIADIDQDSNISLVHYDVDIQGRYKDISTAEFNISTAKPVSTAGAANPSTRQILSPQQQIDPKNKGKGKMVESEKPSKKKDQVKADEELAKRLEEEMQAELEEESSWD
ncbi:hypothetical protein Tco_1193786 [Tanacetum coccineum]